MIPLAIVAALSVAAAPSCGLPPLRAEPLPFTPGESLAFDVDVMGAVKAGTLAITVEPPILRGSLIPLRARLRNASVFAKVRRVRGYALSWVDAKTLRPQRYRDEGEDDGVLKGSDVRFDRGGALSVSWTVGAKKGVATAPRRGDALDVLSTIYYLRAARLRPGEEVCFDLVANHRVWRLRGTLAPGTERVESSAGIFDAVRFDAVLTRADGTGAPRPLHLWYGTDRRRLPLAAVSEIELGPVRAMLSRASGPGPHPQVD